MEYSFIDLNADLIKAWKKEFQGFSNINIEKGDITKVKCDAIVSPANSFGFMDGGVDYAISNRLGWDLQLELQNKIKNLEEGELLVGKAMIIKTNDSIIKYLISAPTMRIPTEFNISTSINAYLAMKAVLISVKNYNEIKSIAIPGFCTGTGKMRPDIAAKQMHYAFKEIVLGNKMIFKSFSDAKSYHRLINPLGE